MQSLGARRREVQTFEQILRGRLRDGERFADERAASRLVRSLLLEPAHGGSMNRPLTTISICAIAQALGCIAGPELETATTQIEGAPLPANCDPDGDGVPDPTCLVDVPGAVCANGDPTYYLYTDRGAGKLLVYFMGGGACWSKASCQAGLASSLERIPYPSAHMGSPEDWGGWFDASDPDNPAAGFDVVVVPYCTADAHTGDREINYAGPDESPYIIRHRGYRNARLILDDVRKRFRAPAQVVGLGCSAGGLGVTYNLRQIRARYPTTSLSVVDDSGLLAKPPHMPAASASLLFSNWGNAATFPMVNLGPNGVADPSDVLRYNIARFPNVRMGLVQSYQDIVMTAYGAVLRAPHPRTFVADTLVDLADNDIGEAANAKVFYIRDWMHCYDGLPLGDTWAWAGRSPPDGPGPEDVSYSEWATAMVEGDPSWSNVRPPVGDGAPCADDACSEYDTLAEVAPFADESP
jgi:hypothetical protein